MEVSIAKELKRAEKGPPPNIPDYEYTHYLLGRDDTTPKEHEKLLKIKNLLLSRSVEANSKFTEQWAINRSQALEDQKKKEEELLKAELELKKKQQEKMKEREKRAKEKRTEKVTDILNVARIAV